MQIFLYICSENVNFRAKMKGLKSNAVFVLRNIGIAIVLIAVGLLCLIVWLRRYTEHGIEVEVPSVTGMYIEEARGLLGSEGLRLEVIDSTWSHTSPLGTIVEQTPGAGSHCKHGRSVYVIVNASSRKRVPLPDLRDMSYRQASGTLRSLGIGVEEVVYEPSEYKDIVLDIRQDGVSVPEGARIEEGSSVTVVVGFGKGTEKVSTPELRGKTLYEARALLLGSYLTVGAIEYDREVTSENSDSFVVYMQEPFVGTMILQGSRVDLQMTTDMEKALLGSQSEEGEEEFF